jgi:hypothetical protein
MDESFKKFLVEDKERFIRIIGTAAVRNPTLSRAAFKAYADEVEATFPAMSKELEAAYAGAPNRTAFDRKADDIRTRYGVMIRDTIDKLPEGRQAQEAVARQMQPESIFMAPIKWAYDGDNGGVQWGGLMGGALAAFAGFKFADGMGTLAGVLATAAAGLIGAYAAHRFIDPEPVRVAVPDLRKEDVSAARGKALKKGDAADRSTPVEGSTPPDFARIMDEAGKKPDTEVADARKMGLKDPERLAGLGTGPSLL